MIAAGIIDRIYTAGISTKLRNLIFRFKTNKSKNGAKKIACNFSTNAMENASTARFDHACQLFGDNRSEDIHHQIGRSIRKRNPEAASHRKRDLPVPLCRSAHRAFGYIKPKHPRPFPERQRQPAGVIAFSASCVQHNWRPVFPKILQRQPVQLIAKGLI